MQLLSVSLVLLAGIALAWAETKSPKVHVYTEKPLEYGEKNKILCHVSEFHPPNCIIKLLHNDQELVKAKQNDLVFRQDWTYYSTKFDDIIINQGDKVQCVVEHNSQAPKFYSLNPII